MRLALFLGLLWFGSSEWASGASLTRISGKDLPSFEGLGSETPEGFRLALERQLPRCQGLPRRFLFGSTWVTRERWCDETAKWFLGQIRAGLSVSSILEKAKKELEWYRSTGKPDTHEVQFTGYYFPVYRARLRPDAVFRFPLYRTPASPALSRLTREEIEAGGRLRGKGLEIAYLDNPVDPYILQVQGSGAVLLEDSSGRVERIHLNYASENGRPYASLGKAMREAGIPETYINLQGIRRYFIHEHPELWPSFSNRNSSYVFFKKADQGPFGSLGALLTPEHSIAVDPGAFPLGAIGLIRTERPDGISGDQAVTWRSFTQWVSAQDTGGAIRTPGRVDVFWGEGRYAEVAAGQTDRLGELYFAIVPKH